MKSVFSYAMCATPSLNTAFIFCILHNCFRFCFCKATIFAMVFQLYVNCVDKYLLNYTIEKRYKKW